MAANTRFVNTLHSLEQARQYFDFVASIGPHQKVALDHRNCPYITPGRSDTWLGWFIQASVDHLRVMR